MTVEGSTVSIDGLVLDGALVVRCLNPQASVAIEGLVCVNAGWTFVELTAKEMREEGGRTANERARGYRLVKEGTMEIVVEEEGDWIVGEEGVLRRR